MILNRWIELYQLGPQEASVLVYVTLVPMSVAPLSYGALLGSIDTRRIISGALLGLTIVTAVLGWAESYLLIFMCRLSQGVFLPALMTATMSRLSAAGGSRERQRGPRLISYYLCATVIGGLIGRLVTGHLAEVWSLGEIWWLWSASLCLITALSRHFIRAPLPFNARRLSLPAIKRAVTTPAVRSILFCGALMFGVFAAALNLLPLRATELGLLGGSGAVANRYWGYLSGVIIALLSRRIDRALGGGGGAPALGFAVMAGGLYWGTLDLSYAPLFVMVLALCGGLFITHPLLAGRITQLSPHHRGLMSGLYVSSYYIGGAILSWGAGALMHHFGWSATLLILTAIASLTALFAWRALNLLTQDTLEDQ